MYLYNIYVTQLIVLLVMVLTGMTALVAQTLEEKFMGLNAVVIQEKRQLGGILNTLILIIVSSLVQVNLQSVNIMEELILNNAYRNVIQILLHFMVLCSQMMYLGNVSQPVQLQSP